MQKSKFGTGLAMMFFFSITIVGCTTTYLDMKNWEGRTVNDLYFEWGKADKVEVTNKGETAHTWVFKREVDGQVKTCEKTFYSRNTGNDEVIVNTSYKDCLFLIAK